MKLQALLDLTVEHILLAQVDVIKSLASDNTYQFQLISKVPMKLLDRVNLTKLLKAMTEIKRRRTFFLHL